MRKIQLLVLLFCLPSGMLMLSGCKGGGLNIFTIEDDKTLGLQTAQEIAAHPADYPLLDKNQYASAYAYLNAMRDDILNAGQVQHRADFDWDLNIIHNDSIENAFCTPGGHIYVYTGLMKYLDNASSLAGVLGHEMAHADRRHSTQQLTKIYGIQTLLDVVLGNKQNMITEIATQLVFLQFSRDNETEADSYSVRFLCPSMYHAEGASYFFQKIIDQGAATPPEFLSTHPSPDHRVQNIQSEAQTLGCAASITQQQDDVNYTQFKQSLP